MDDYVADNSWFSKLQPEDVWFMAKKSTKSEVNWEILGIFAFIYHCSD